MGYHITLSRPESQSGISRQEWKDFVRTRAELTPVEDSNFETVIFDGEMGLALHYAEGAVFTKNPNGPKIIRYMVSIAPHFGGVVTGDEGETFVTEADCGTDEKWTAPSLRTPWQKRELSRGMRIALGLLLGIVLIAIMELLKGN